MKIFCLITALVGVIVSFGSLTGWVPVSCAVVAAVLLLASILMLVLNIP